MQTRNGGLKLDSLIWRMWLMGPAASPNQLLRGRKSQHGWYASYVNWSVSGSGLEFVPEILGSTRSWSLVSTSRGSVLLSTG